MSEAEEQTYTDVFGAEIVLKNAVRSIILLKHPEVASFIDQIGVVLNTPDEIRQSSSDERVMLYYCFKDEILDGKWVVVVVKRVDRNFVSTVYVTDKIKSGEVLWTK